MSDSKKEIPRTMTGFMRFVLKEIVIQRKWLLLPFWILLLAIGIFILLGGGSALLPAIYIAF